MKKVWYTMSRLLFLILLPFTLIADPIPRRIIAFWDSVTDKIVEESLIHKTLEMPLNYLGLDVIYYDINKPLPTLSEQDGVRGILVCFDSETKTEDPKKFINWLGHAIDIGKKVVLMGNVGFMENTKGKYTSGDLQNRVFEKIGLRNTQEWIDYTSDYSTMNEDSQLISFEKKLPSLLPPFYQMVVNNSIAKSYLKIGVKGEPGTDADLVIISPNGGYIASNYAYDFDQLQIQTNPRSLGWYVNPFRFFELAFNTTGLPVPDTTTLAGRRIFISTCHGDNFNMETSIHEYKGQGIYCSEVLLEKVIKPNPDLPITIAFIAADFDPKWAMKKKSLDILASYVNLPQVEVASHTYSHPFDWEFFHTGGPEKERDYLSLYPDGAWENSESSWFRAKEYQLTSSTKLPDKLNWGYGRPRAFANEPFNVEKEIIGSVDYLNNLIPKDKKINLLIWSGDSRPWDVPALLTKKAGIKNFGGGDVRFDNNYPSNLYVFPLARKPGGVIQLYTSADAENVYTDGWKDDFYAFKFLPQTLINTDKPRRIKPIELFYHSFSGQFVESVNAILSNIKFIRTQSPISIHISRFCDIGTGFFSVEFEPVGDKVWKVKNREGLQTIRFDAPENQRVNLSKSNGVVGYRKYQDSLYIYLDAAVKEPVIALNESQNKNTPYLVESSWEVWGVEKKERQLSFSTQGWGKLVMSWNMGKDGTYRVFSSVLPKDLELKSDQGMVAIELELPYNKKFDVNIQEQ